MCWCRSVRQCHEMLTSLPLTKNMRLQKLTSHYFTMQRQRNLRYIHTGLIFAAVYAVTSSYFIKQARPHLTHIHAPALSSVVDMVSNKKWIPPSATGAGKDETVSSCLPLKIDLRALWLHISRVIAQAFCPVSARSAQIPQTTAGFNG